MKNETRAAMLRNRIDVLSARKKENANIINKLKREIKNLGEN